MSKFLSWATVAVAASLVSGAASATTYDENVYYAAYGLTNGFDTSPPSYAGYAECGMTLVNCSVNTEGLSFFDLTPYNHSLTEWQFSFAGAGVSASGLLTVETTTQYPPQYYQNCPSCNSGPAYLVTGITGYQNGGAISGPLALGSFAGNDNLLYLSTYLGGAPAGPYLDWAGLAFSVTTTPLPTTWTMLLIGLAGLGFVAYRRQRQTPVLAA